MTKIPSLLRTCARRLPREPRVAWISCRGSRCAIGKRHSKQTQTFIVQYATVPSSGTDGLFPASDSRRGRPAHCRCTFASLWWTTPSIGYPPQTSSLGSWNYRVTLSVFQEKTKPSDALRRNSLQHSARFSTAFPVSKLQKMSVRQQIRAKVLSHMLEREGHSPMIRFSNTDTFCRMTGSRGKEKKRKRTWVVGHISRSSCSKGQSLRRTERWTEWTHPIRLNAK